MHLSACIIDRKHAIQILFMTAESSDLERNRMMQQVVCDSDQDLSQYQSISISYPNSVDSLFIIFGMQILSVKLLRPEVRQSGKKRMTAELILHTFSLRQMIST